MLDQTSPVLILSLRCGIAVVSDRVEELLTSYHNYTSLMAELESLVESYPHLARIYSLGNSTQNRALAVIQISEGVTEVNIKPSPLPFTIPHNCQLILEGSTC